MQQANQYVSAPQFFDRAQELLEPISERVESEIIPRLEEHAGRWHPSGYMVYSLGTHATLGSLRFHIWPKDLRRSETREGTPRDVHDHVLHIASRAVGGEFADDIYQVERVGTGLSDEEVAAKGLLRVFTFPDDQPSNGILVTDGRCVRATPIERRNVPKGDYHTIEAGVFHAPAIPEDSMGATISFSSPRVNLVGPHILATGSAEPIKGTRGRSVSVDEALFVKEQLM
jgi:hypothetical protein